MFDIKNLFGTFKGQKLNGALIMIMQEEENFEKANLLLKEWIKTHGLFKDIEEMIMLLEQFHLVYFSLTLEHKNDLVELYVENIEI